jgi:hypothetical protein
MEIAAKEMKETETPPAIEVLDNGIDSDIDILRYCCLAPMLPVF